VLVEPAGTDTPFEANAVPPDMPMQVYAERRRIADQVAMSFNDNGNSPSVVVKSIVAAATDSKPKLRCAASPNARRISTARRLVPARAFLVSVAAAISGRGRPAACNASSESCGVPWLPMAEVRPCLQACARGTARADNIGSGGPTRWRDVVSMVEQVTCRPVARRHVPPAAEPRGQLAVATASVAGAKEERRTPVRQPPVSRVAQPWATR
jgi:nucleoside-diphosphate-sugar epimerase